MYVCMYVWMDDVVVVAAAAAAAVIIVIVLLLGGLSRRWCGVRGMNGVGVGKANKNKEKKRKRNKKKGRIRVCGRGKYHEITRTVCTYRSLCPRPIDIVVPI